MSNKLQKRIILIMTVVGLLILFGSWLVNRSDHRKINLLLSHQQHEQKALLDKIIELKFKSAENYAYDYTYWDDMVAYMRSGDPDWAEENIVTSMPTFGVDIAWVYRPDLSLLFTYNEIEADHLELLPLPLDDLRMIISQGPISHFFLLSDVGLLEIYGASIHPTSDVERITPAQGYFFVGVLWDAEYLEEISELSSTDLHLALPEETLPQTEKQKFRDFQIINVKALQGWEGTHLINLISTGEAALARTLSKQLNRQYLSSMLYLLILFILLVYVIYCQINQPLNLLSKSLKKNDPGIISELTRQKTEFGSLAVMLTEFFRQKYLLEKEITERKKAEEQLRLSDARNKAILAASPDLMFINDRDGIFLDYYANDSSSLATQPELFLGRSIKEVIPEIADKAFKCYEAALATKQLQIFEYSLSIQDDIRHFEARINAMDDQRLLTIIRDITERKRMEEALSSSEEKYRTLFSNSALAIGLRNLDGSYIEFNESYNRMLGYSPDELKELTTYDITHPEDIEISKEKIRLIAEGKSAMCRYEKRYFHKNGSIVWGDICIQPLHDSQNNIIAVIGSVNDVTERKKVDEALRASEELHRKVLQTMPDLIIRTELDGTIIFSNQPPTELGKFAEKQEIIGKNMLSFIAPQDRIRALENTKLMFESTLGVKEYKLVTNKGEFIDCEINGEVIRDGNDMPVGMVYVIRDVTQLKKVERQIKESEEKYFSLFNQSVEGIFLHDLEGNIIDVNQMAVRQTGYTKEELLQMKVFDLHSVSPDSINMTRTEILEHWKRWKPEETVILEAEHRRKDGSVFPVQVSARPVFYGDVKLILSLTQDITERKKSEEQIRRNLEEKKLLLRELYHRTKNNMQMIASMLKIQARTNKDPHLTEIFEDIINKINSMALVHQKLYEAQDLSRINLKNYIEDFLIHLVSSFRQSKGRINLELRLEDVMVTIDTAVPLGFVLTELISNVFKHAFPNEQPGKISIDLKRLSSGEMILKISDDGVGISDALDLRQSETMGLKNVFSIVEYQLQGTIAYQVAGGLKWQISLLDDPDRTRV